MSMPQVSVFLFSFLFVQVSSSFRAQCEECLTQESFACRTTASVTTGGGKQAEQKKDGCKEMKYSAPMRVPGSTASHLCIFIEGGQII